jgi:hypothetical protein
MFLGTRKSSGVSWTRSGLLVVYAASPLPANWLLQKKAQLIEQGKDTRNIDLKVAFEDFVNTARGGNLATSF